MASSTDGQSSNCMPTAEEKEKERQRKNVEANTLTVIRSIERIVTRTRRSPDPAIRHTLFVSNIITILDVIAAAAEIYSSELSLDIRDKIKNLIGEIDGDLSELLNWIQSPVYSPKHPYGESVVEACKEDFEEKASEASN